MSRYTMIYKCFGYYLEVVKEIYGRDRSMPFWKKVASKQGC